MDCSKVRQHLDRMKSGELDPETRHSVDQHLAGCSDCRSLLSTATVAQPPAGGSEAVAAVLFPEELAGVPRGWVYAVGALASSTVVLAVAVGYLLSRTAPAEATQTPRSVRVAQIDPEPARPERPAAAAENKAPPAPTPPEESAAPEPEAAPQAAPEAPTTVAPATPTPSVKPAAKAAKPPARTNGTAPEPAASASPPKEATPPPAAKPSEPAPADEPPPKPKDEIEKLLFEAAGTTGKAPPVKDENPPEATDATGLTRKQVMDVMNSIQGEVHQCSVDTGKKGIVNIRATIVPSGRVRTVRVTGMFAGTPAGDCVAKAVRSAVFPTFVGQPQPVNYPVALR